MKSFSLDSPESPSVMGVTSSSQHNSGGSLSEHQQQPQQFYESAGAGYPPVYLPGAYQQQHQAQYVQQHNQQPNPYQQIEQQQQQAQQSYLASAGSDELCGARSHQHQAHANYHHRHSYHNPPYHYQQEQERLGRQLEQQNQQSSSQSALNSLVNQDGLLGSSQLAKGALGAGKRGSNDKDMACARQECKCYSACIGPGIHDEPVYACLPACPPPLIRVALFGDFRSLGKTSSRATLSCHA